MFLSQYLTTPTAPHISLEDGYFLPQKPKCKWPAIQRYTYRVLQTIQMKLILLWAWAERAVLGRAKTALKFKYET